MPAESDAPAVSIQSLNSNAPFKNWYQGFNHGTDGWFGEETAGELGWCGGIERVDRSSGAVAPSAGEAYATVEQDGCNALWTAVFGPGLRSAPWSPGPDFAAFSSVWPTGGFVMELDIYLDPSWTAEELEPGTYIFGPDGGFPVFTNTTVFTYAASLRHLDTGAFLYFGVPVLPDDGKLLIFGHEVTESGWYTFRHVFGDDGDQLTVAFELAGRNGDTLLTMPYDTSLFGVPLAGLTATEFGSGYLWFLSISPGLDLPIDEHHIRRGS